MRGREGGKERVKEKEGRASMLQIILTHDNRVATLMLYRQLSMQHHPDRGGDQDTFMKIAKAYEACVTHSSIMSCCNQLFLCVSAV